MINYKKNYIQNKSYIKKDFLIIVVSSFLYVINKTVIIRYSRGLINYLFRCYFNDFLAGLLIITLINILIILAFSKKIGSFFQTMIIILIIGLFWEYAPNLIKENAVSDLWDIVAYEVGGLLYWIIHKGGKKYE